MSVRITGIEKNSCAARHGIQPGEKLIAIDGNPILDILDYRFYEINPNLTLQIENTMGEVRQISIKKREKILPFFPMLINQTWKHSPSQRCKEWQWA